jgi:hypothetical protein
MIIVVNSLLTFSPEFQAEHFEKSLPSGNLGARTRVFVILFAWKSEQQRRPKVECGHAVYEQWIMLVGRVPTNRSNNCTQPVSETALFHVSTRCELMGSTPRPSLLVGFAKRWLRASEVAARSERNAGRID